MDNLIETGLMLAGFLMHVVLKARELDRATLEREPFFGIIAASLWGPDSRWSTLTVVGMIVLLGLTGTASAALATVGVTITEDGGRVLVFCSAGYGMESIAPKLLAVVSKKAEG